MLNFTLRDTIIFWLLQQITTKFIKIIPVRNYFVAVVVQVYFEKTTTTFSGNTKKKKRYRSYKKKLNWQASLFKRTVWLYAPTITEVFKLDFIWLVSVTTLYSKMHTHTHTYTKRPQYATTPIKIKSSLTESWLGYIHFCFLLLVVYTIWNHNDVIYDDNDNFMLL